jgi:hypothetical protein
VKGIRGLLLAAVAVFCLFAGAARADAAQFLTDPSFEATNSTNRVNPFWSQTAERPGKDTVLCDAGCYSAGYPPKKSGLWMAWFGAWGQGGEGIQSNASTLSQTITTPAVTGAELHLWFYKESFSQPSSAIEFKVDGNVLLRIDGTNQASYPNNQQYNEIVLPVGDLTAGSHTVLIDYTEMHDPFADNTEIPPFAWPTNWWIDDVTLTGTPVGMPPVPTVTATNPVTASGSGANNQHPKVLGSAQAGSTVKLYGNPTCTGDVLGSGPGGAMASPGIEATVPHNSTTTFYATAENENGVSACSATNVTYYEYSVPGQPLLNGYPPAGTNNNHPMIKGAAAADSTVKIYKGGSCTVEANLVATGTSAQLGGAGIQVDVLNNTTTTFRAQVENDGGISPCSNTVTYKEVTPQPSMPTFFATVPVSPSTSNTPKLRGDYVDDSAWGGTVRIYTTANCTGTVAGTGTAEEFVDPGIGVTVADGTTTSFYASVEQPLTLEGWAGVSPCTAVPAVYTDSSAAAPPPAPPAPIVPPVITPPDNSALLAKALKKCKKKKGSKKKKKCKKKARKAFR